mgnify:FL=1
MNYRVEYKNSIDAKEDFWEEKSRDLPWIKEPTKTLTVGADGFPSWFDGGLLNTSYACLDHHVDAGRGDQDALIYDSPVSNTIETYSYSELRDRVARVAGSLQELGVTKGAVVIIYMPMIPEAVISMLACARIGAIHSVVFGGFAPEELCLRIDDAKPEVILSASCGIEFERIIPYQPLIREALRLAKHQPKAVVIKSRKEMPAPDLGPAELDWDLWEGNSTPVDCVALPSRHPLYILYTSGTTGKPKGIVRDNGGHAVALKYSMKAVYDVQEGDVFWAASDVGWVVGHSYIVYGPLLAGCTTVLYEGKPVKTPDAGAFWRVISQHRVKVFFVAPTAIRAIRKEDSQGKLIERYDISALESQFVAGERLDPATYRWLVKHLKIPVIDHWWQTETGWPVCSSFPGMQELDTREGSCGKPCPGWDVMALDEEGTIQDPGEEGSLVFGSPLPPGALLTVWGDEKRFHDSYWKRFPGFYLTGDSGFLDSDGFVYVMGRTDDVINVAGHRLSTGRMEEVLAADSAVAECAVVAKKDPDKGEIPVGFVILNLGLNTKEEEVFQSLVKLMRESVGAFANFKLVFFVEKLPKTRSGKILRRLLRSMIEKETYSIPSTIEDPGVIKHIETVLSQSAP